MLASQTAYIGCQRLLEIIRLFDLHKFSNGPFVVAAWVDLHKNGRCRAGRGGRSRSWGRLLVTPGPPAGFTLLVSIRGLLKLSGARDDVVRGGWGVEWNRGIFIFTR